ncbi:MAG: hypothetical protein Q6363_000525 [Candidatus Njordarchaeota archaeon]
MKNKKKNEVHHANKIFVPIWAAVGIDGNIVYVAGNLKPADIINVREKNRYVIMGPAPIVSNLEEKTPKVICEYKCENNDRTFLRNILSSKCCDISKNKMYHVKNFEPAILKFKVIGRLWDSPYNALYVATGGPKDNPWTIYIAIKKDREDIPKRMREGNEYVGYGWFRWFSDNILHFRLILALDVEKVNGIRLINKSDNESIYTMSALGKVI